MEKYLLLAQENIEKLLRKIESNEELCNAGTYEDVMDLYDSIYMVVEIYNEM